VASLIPASLSETSRIRRSCAPRRCHSLPATLKPYSRRGVSAISQTHQYVVVHSLRSSDCRVVVAGGWCGGDVDFANGLGRAGSVARVLRTMSDVRVLVVDDDAAVRQSLSTALGRGGYEVLPADGGMAALAHMTASSIDAMVLDVAMPEPNGLEVCRRLRARGDRTPILMLTARDLVDDRVAGLDAGADDYLVKPFAVAELRARLRALLRRNSAPGGRRADAAAGRADGQLVRPGVVAR